MSKKAQLNEKHWKAIELIQSGRHSIKDIAISLGWAPETLYKLVEGSPVLGNTALLFKAEIRKIHKKNAEEIKDILNTNKRKTLRIIDGVLTRIEALDYTSNEDAALVVTILNALNKAPSVEINATSYNYYSGMSPEERVYELNRLASLARGASVRGGLPEIKSGGSGRVLTATVTDSGHDQEQ